MTFPFKFTNLFFAINEIIMKNVNPFIVNNYIKPKYFCNRTSETELITQSLSKKSNILLISRKGIGKTALIRHVFYNIAKSKSNNLIYIDLLNTPTLKLFLIGFLQKIIKSYSNKSSKKNKKIVKLIMGESVNGLLFLYDLELIELLEKFTAAIAFLKSQETDTIIAIDNYQLGAQYVFSKFEELILYPLLINDNTPLILSGTKKMFSPEKTKHIFLDNIKVEEHKNFILKMFAQKGLSLSKKGILKIFDWSQGDTKAVQLLCSKLWEKENGKIRSATVDYTINKILTDYHSNYSVIKDLLSIYQWKLLRAIADQKAPFQITSRNFIKKHELNAPSSVKTAIDALLEKELIFKENNRYQITDVVFGTWLASNLSQRK